MSKPKTRLARLAALHRAIRDGGRVELFPLRLFLWLLSFLYGGLVSVRNLLFDLGLRRRCRPEALVVSVGNLTTGGTGKTPVVAAVAKAARQAGREIAILTRGYRRGDNLGMEESDEVSLFRALLPGIDIFVDSDRCRGAAAALAEGADLLLLDDGFQHRRIARDVEILLVDARDPFGGDCMLPLGLLREPKRGARRASVVIVTRSDRVSPEELAKTTRRVSELVGSETPIVTERHAAVGVRSLELPERRPLGSLEGQRVLAFSGIADPATLAESLVAAGAEVDGALDFGDHHEFHASELAEIDAEARRLGVDVVVTTEKDLMRIERWGGELPLLALSIEARFDSAEEALWKLLGFAPLR